MSLYTSHESHLQVEGLCALRQGYTLFCSLQKFLFCEISLRWHTLLGGCHILLLSVISKYIQILKKK